MALPRLTADQIPTLPGREDREVDVHAWGRSVVIRGLTAQQINRCARRAEDPQRGGEVNPDVRNGWYLVEGVVDPTIDIKIAEKWLTETAFGPVSVILAAVLEESGLTESAREAAKSAAAEEPAPSV